MKKKKLDIYKIEKEIDYLIEANCTHYEYEGTEIDKGTLRNDVMNVIIRLNEEEE